MLVNLYDHALDGERCWLRHDDDRLESSRTIGPWFRWASVGIHCMARLADDVGLAAAGIHPIGRRVVAGLAAT
jgi:hypothetical protein